MIRLTNSKTRRKEPFAPLDPSNVRMYVCGPTVYDFAHIGNARPPVVFDVLVRLLRRQYGADKVIYARNVTDVDDKIIASAEKEGVDPSVIMAIYGKETSYGSVTGTFDLLEALASLAYEGRRRELFQSEFLAALKLVDLYEGYEPAQGRRVVNLCYDDVFPPGDRPQGACD